jgi:hypothetical protein
MQQVFGIRAAARPLRDALQNPCPKFPAARNFCHYCFSPLTNLGLSSAFRQIFFGPVLWVGLVPIVRCLSPPQKRQD